MIVTVRPTSTQVRTTAAGTDATTQPITGDDSDRRARDQGDPSDVWQANHTAPRLPCAVDGPARLRLGRPNGSHRRPRSRGLGGAPVPCRPTLRRVSPRWVRQAACGRCRPKVASRSHASRHGAPRQRHRHPRDLFGNGRCGNTVLHRLTVYIAVSRDA